MLVVVALIVLNGGTLGYLLINKGPQRGNFPPTHHRPEKQIIERLKLTPEQAEVFEDLKNEHSSGIKGFNEKSKELYQAYFALLKKDSPDLVAADSMQQLLAQVQEQKDSLTFDHFMKLRILCTDEQKPLFDDFVDELGNVFTAPPPPKPRP